MISLGFALIRQVFYDERRAGRVRVSVEPTVDEPTYREILSSIIKRFMRLVGAASALLVARRTPDLVVDDDGNVLSYDENNPLVTITQLIDSYGAIFGAAAVALSQKAVRPDAAPTEILQSAGLLQPPTAPINLLLVDDAVLFRESLVNLLQQQPEFTVVGQASSVEEAIRLARALQPEMILMDFSLPDGTGLEATITILAERPDTKIVFLTIHEDDERLFSAVRAGAKGYLFKNVHTTELIKTLQGVARGEAGLSRSLASRVLEEFARSLGPEAEAAFEKTELTPREVEIVRELARGASNRAIAEKFVISESTVKNHIRNVLTKLRVRSRRDIAKYARDHGLLKPPPA